MLVYTNGFKYFEQFPAEDKNTLIDSNNIQLSELSQTEAVSEEKENVDRIDTDKQDDGKGSFQKSKKNIFGNFQWVGRIFLRLEMPLKCT